MKAVERRNIKEISIRPVICQIMPAINGMTIRNGVYLFKPFRLLKFNDNNYRKFKDKEADRLHNRHLRNKKPK